MGRGRAANDEDLHTIAGVEWSKYSKFARRSKWDLHAWLHELQLLILAHGDPYCRGYLQAVGFDDGSVDRAKSYAPA